MKTTFILLMVGLVFPAHALEPQLIRLGETWKFSTLSVPGWQRTEFDDTVWKGAISGFVIPEEEHQTLRADPRPSRQYLRKSFLIADPGQIKSLILSVDHEFG